MKVTQSKASFWSRVSVAPAIIALISTSVIVGYASSDIWPDRGHHVSYALHLPILSADAQGQGQSNADTSSDASDQAADPVANYKTALALIKDNYYGANVDAKKTRQLTYEAIRGMLGSLHDQFTSFLDPSQWMQMQAMTKGDYEGIGAMLTQGIFPTSPVKVEEPIEGGPAEKLGIKAGDIITRVDGKSVIGKDIDDVVDMIKGKHGTVVHLGILRGKQSLEFAITRARVEPPVVKYSMVDPEHKIGYLALKEFNEKSIDQMNHAFADLNRQGMRGLIFDLRGNPGGLLDVAIDVASVFIPQDEHPDLKNVVVYIHEGPNKEQPKTLREEDDSYKRVPLVVLVDENSASASEIVSAAIKDYGVGTLIGGRTFGKGKVQTLYPLDDDSALRLTTALYYPPSHYDLNFQEDDEGNKIPGTGGVLPNVEVKQSPKWQGPTDTKDDLQLEKALEFMRDRLGGMTTAQATQQVRGSH